MTTLADKVENPPVDKASIKPTIIKNVLTILGKPKDLLKISVASITESRYRVNIFVRTEEKPNTDIKISDSFFITISNDGTIISSNPEIVRRY
jgi:hypothetical protein